MAQSLDNEKTVSGTRNDHYMTKYCTSQKKTKQNKTKRLPITEPLLRRINMNTLVRPLTKGGIFVASASKYKLARQTKISQNEESKKIFLLKKYKTLS